MIFLVVADLHYDLRKFDWVADIASEVDAVIMAGDHLEIASTVARPAQSVLVQKYFQRIRERAPLIVSSGNHDLDVADGNGEMTARWIRNARHFQIPTDGDSVVIGDTLFTICPWIDGERQRAVQTERFASASKDHAGRWVWVYHSPPDGSPTSFGRGRSWGDHWLSEWIEMFSPSIVLAGHIHEAPFSKGGRWVDRIGATFVFNAGHQIGPRPSFILIDTLARTASWSSQAGTEQIALDGAPGPIDPHPISLFDLPADVGRAARRLES